MPIARRFLDPTRPALPAAADYLLESCAGDGLLDLSRVIMVVPGGRAGRRLLEILVAAADQRQRALLPPDIQTVGSVPELLYQPQWPFADDTVQRLAWAHALRGVDRELVTQVIAQLPDDDDVLRWMELGEVLRVQHRELAADGLDFADVVKRTEAAGESLECRRWRILRRVQEAYLETLDGLHLWDVQTARLVAIRQRECHTDKQIVLLGAVDLNRALRQMLDQVADRVTALIQAPPEWADRFDEHGCLVPSAWQDVHLAVAIQQVRCADDPADQADAAVRCIAAYGGKYRADEITIGVPDERIVPQIERQLQQCELPCRFGPGVLLATTPPFRLLGAIAEYVQRGRYQDLASLVRHCDMDDWIRRQGVQGDWLTELDTYYGTHLQSSLSRQWLGDAEHRQKIKKVHDAVQGLVADLSGDPRPLGRWSEPIVNVLLAVYGETELDRDNPRQRVLLEACQALHQVLVDHQQNVPEMLAPVVAAQQAIAFALDKVKSTRVPPPADEAAIELVGWLELPLDDAPAMVVTSFNDRFVPRSVNSDPFLPNTLRSQLGLEDNARRYARDAYALSVLLSTREQLTLIVGRRDVDNDRLTPSRLLFAADREAVAERALALFGEPLKPETRRPLAGGLVSTRKTPDFPYLRPEPLAEPIRGMRVTDFRSYLACPYRFYLSRVLKIRALDDAAEELDGGAFGELIHRVLQQFGEGESRDSTDAQQIREVLRDTLDRCTAEIYGRQVLAPVSVQTEQLRLRLDQFAEKQARWAAEGWRIEHTEVPGPGQQATFDVDGELMILRGRIDRIDVNRETGQRVILDYKSSDTAKRPDQVHQRRGEWVDLQLPLYRCLAQYLGIEGPVGLGYVLLPRDTSQIEFQLAEWTEQELAAADDVARDVVRRIRRQEFWPPTDPPPDFSEEYAPLCQDGVFDKPTTTDD